MSKKTRRPAAVDIPSTSKAAQKTAARVAFELAVTLAAKNGVLQLEAAPLDTHTDAYYEDLEEVRAVLKRAYVKRGAEASRDRDALLAQIADRDVEIEVSNAFGEVTADAQEAGYVYGLAVGLMMAGQGGAR
jgi:hypothetical protein